MNSNISPKPQKAVELNDGIITPILNYLEKEDRNTIAQPHLIVGVSGSGKTTLLSGLFENINDRMPQLKPIFIDGISLFSTDDIWKHCPTYSEKAQRLVLLIDNIQYYFERTHSDEQFSLRGKLNNSGGPILIATSSKVLPAFTDYKAAFFDGFKISYIKPVSEEDYENLVKTPSDMVRINNLMLYLPKTHRSLSLAAKIMANSDNSSMDINILRDYFSCFYQAKFDGYVCQIQKILLAMATSDKGVDLKNIRETTHQENGKISPYLKLMVDKKIIDRTTKTQRSGIYTISDPLFKLWLQGKVVDANRVPVLYPSALA